MSLTFHIEYSLNRNSQGNVMSHAIGKDQAEGFELSVDCEIPSEGITVIFGPSGCGKTTLLRCLVGLTHAPEADIRFNNKVWQSADAFIKPPKRKVAMVFQQHNLLPHLNVTENIKYAIKRRKQSGLSFDEVVGLFDLSTLLLRHSSELSGGEQQRVAMARALASAPDLLLMDEPMSALDDSRKSELLAYLKKVKQYLPIVYVTHSRQEMMRLADHLVLMEAGKVLQSGAFWDVVRSSGVLTGEACWSVVSGVVTRHDEAYGLSLVSLSGQALWVNHIHAAVGEPVRLLFNGSDLSISLTPPDDSSILNVLPAVITRVESVNAAQLQLSLSVLPDDAKADCGAVFDDVLDALITRKSFEHLKLSEKVLGDSAKACTVYVQIKSVAVLT